MYDFEIVTAIMCRNCGHIFGANINTDRLSRRKV